MLRYRGLAHGLRPRGLQQRAGSRGEGSERLVETGTSTAIHQLRDEALVVLPEFRPLRNAFQRTAQRSRRVGPEIVEPISELPDVGGQYVVEERLQIAG